MSLNFSPNIEHAAICAAGLALYAATVAALPFRVRKQFSQAGTLLHPLKAKTSRAYAAVLAVAPLVMAALALREFDRLMTAIICLCAVAGSATVFADTLRRRRSGIYERALAADGKIVFYDDIISLPTLAWEEAPGETLEVLCKSRDSLTITFADAEERAFAVGILLEINKGLRPSDS